MRSIAIGLALLLVGCVTAKPVPLPNGETGYVIEDCDGMAQCYKKAAEVCGGKYEILDKDGSSVGMITGSGGILSGLVIPQYSMTFKCTAAETTP